MDARHEETVAKVRRSALSAFGEEDGRQWLMRRSRYFGGKTPLDMAETEGGGERVVEFLSYLTAAEAACKQAGISDSES